MEDASHIFVKVSISKRIIEGRDSYTYIDDFLHVILRRLLIPEDTLKTNDKNQKKFTVPPNDVLESGSENWRVVAVTLEKKVAIAVILTYLVVALSFSSARNVGKAKKYLNFEPLLICIKMLAHISPEIISALPQLPS